jgi:hypothetical protein
VEIYREYDSLYILERNDKKNLLFLRVCHFRELLPIVLEFRGDLQTHDTQYMFERHDKKLIVFVF